ncbi:MAG: hypothetical protein E7169_00920 [Firmicutes bacterium]|nr:hypothetical protein [Bacillota bacterium]
MKKIIIILFLSVVLLTGCKNKEEEYKNILQDYAKTYYEKHMVGVENQQQAEITLEMLKKANNYGDNYDLSLLKKCDNKTSVTISLNNQKQIINYEYELKCN